MKKILMISPTPTHPANAGNRAHILSLADFFRSRGMNVHFLYLAYESYSGEEMKAYWGEKLHIIEREKLYWPGNLVVRGIRSLNFRMRRLKRWMQRRSGVIDERQFRYNSEVDIHFPAAIGRSILQLQRQEQFDIVNCEYVFMSQALSYFGKSVLKILDTHDRFTDRFAVYLENGMEPSWVSLYEDQEKKALGRADLVIAVQEKEKVYFQRLSDATVVKFTYMPDAAALPPGNFGPRLLFFASGNDINHRTLDYFIQSILPRIIASHPEVQVLVGGSICRNFKSNHLHIRLMGEYVNVKEFYASGGIVINPEMNGTGYKIKTLEALAFGMPVVCTTAGAAGVLDPFLDHIIVTDEPSDFADAVNQLLGHPELCADLSGKAKEWYKRYREEIAAGLDPYLST